MHRNEASYPRTHELCSKETLISKDWIEHLLFHDEANDMRWFADKKEGTHFQIIKQTSRKSVVFGAHLFHKNFYLLHFSFIFSL